MLKSSVGNVAPQQMSYERIKLSKVVNIQYDGQLSQTSLLQEEVRDLAACRLLSAERGSAVEVLRQLPSPIGRGYEALADRLRRSW
jgi:hypothetical protein